MNKYKESLIRAVKSVKKEKYKNNVIRNMAIQSKAIYIGNKYKKSYSNVMKDIFKIYNKVK